MKDTLKIYRRFLMRYKKTAFFGVFGLILASASDVVSPLYLKDFIDLMSSGGEHSLILAGLYRLFWVIIFWRFFHFLGWRIATFCNAFFESRVINDLYDFSFSYLQRHSFNFFNNNFVGSIVKRVNRFVRSFEVVADKLFFDILVITFQIGLVVVVLFNRNFYLGLVLFSWVLVYIALNIFFNRFRLKYDLLRSEADSAVSGVLADTITNQTNVKLFTGYHKEKDNFKKTINIYSKLQRFSWNLNNGFEAVQTLLAFLLEGALIWIGINLWKQGRFTGGDFLLVQAYIITVVNNIWNVGRIIRDVYSNLSEASEMTEILNTPHEIRDVPLAKDLKVKAGEIEYQKVDFSYHETRSILKNFNLSIASGEKIALVGPSGAGKSTLVKLLLRMHDVTAGKILIDSQNIAKVTQESLWKNIALVPQDPILFHRTLRENIRYGRFDATDDEVEAAAKLAHCHEFITELQAGYETYVGERGVKLSGGERQRVAIARAILKNAPILLLDEATSSLDSESEYFIQDALNNLMKGKTVIMIAHRLSTIMSADRILVIDRGIVVEEGCHKDLVRKKNGLYKKLWDLQAGGFIK